MFGAKSSVHGEVLAPNAWVKIGFNASFRGSICARYILVKAGARVRHHRAADTTPKLSETTNPVHRVADSYVLEQNYPNPFNPTTTLRFELPQASEVSLLVYNLRGELVRSLIDGTMNAGSHSLSFDAIALASGVYFCRLQADDNFIQTRKMVLAR